MNRTKWSNAVLWSAFAVVAANGCGNSPNYVVDSTEGTTKTAVSAPEIAEKTSETTGATNALRPTSNRTFDELVAAGMKVEGDGKILDFSDVDGLNGIDFSTDRERWNAVKVVRGQGVLTSETARALGKLPRLTEFLWTDALFVCNDSMGAQVFDWEKSLELKKFRLTKFRENDTFPFGVLKELGKIPNLVDLDLSDSPLNAEACKILGTPNLFPKLTKLNLYRTSVGDSGVDALLPLADRLVSLNLDDAKIGPASADKIAQFSHLTFLHVGRSELDDESVLKFAKLEKLEKIHTTRSKATEAGADALRAQLPNCVVVSQPEN